jgi:hypothetical protein
MERRLGHDFSRVRVHHDLQAAESSRAVDAHAYTVGQHIVFGAGRYDPATREGQRLLAHELTHVVQQRAYTRIETALQRKRCGHDGQPHNCGLGARGPGGGIGSIPLSGGALSVDREIVNVGLPSVEKGPWLADFPTPFVNENKEPAGKETSRIDALRVNETGSTLKLEIAEIKPRSGQFGGCVRATRETNGYVDPLKKLASNMTRISQSIKKRFPQTGLAPPQKNRQSRQVVGFFKEMGIPVDQTPWAEAWEFYNTLQLRWKVIRTAYDTVEVEPFGGGDANKTYVAAKYIIKCENKKTKKKSLGVEELVFMVNKVGGISYGCHERCGEEVTEEERVKLRRFEEAEETARRQEKKEEAEQVETENERKRRKRARKPVVVDAAPGFGYEVPDDFVVEPGRRFIILAPKELADIIDRGLGVFIEEQFKRGATIRVPQWMVENIIYEGIIGLSVLTGLVATAGISGVALAGTGVAATAEVAVAAEAAGTTAAEGTAAATVAAEEAAAAQLGRQIIQQTLREHAIARQLTQEAVALAKAAAAGVSKEAVTKTLVTAAPILAAGLATEGSANAAEDFKKRMNGKAPLAIMDVTNLPWVPKIKSEVPIDGQPYVVVVILKN